MAEQQNSPCGESSGLSGNHETTLQSTRMTACDHMERAAYWLDLAERGWSYGGVYHDAAKIAELHIMFADRVAMSGECGG